MATALTINNSRQRVKALFDAIIGDASEFEVSAVCKEVAAQMRQDPDFVYQ